MTFYGDQIIEFEKVPKTHEEFLKIRDKHSKTMHGGMAVVILAFLCWSERSEELGQKCLITSLDIRVVVKGKEKKGVFTYKGYKLSNQMLQSLNYMKQRQTYRPKSFVFNHKNQNPNPDKQYEFDKDKPFGIKVFRQKTFEVDRVLLKDHKIENQKVLVACSGEKIGGGRPFTMTVNKKGVWKAWEVEKMFLAVENIKEELPEDDL